MQDWLICKIRQTDPEIDDLQNETVHGEAIDQSSAVVSVCQSLLNLRIELPRFIHS